MCWYLHFGCALISPQKQKSFSRHCMCNQPFFVRNIFLFKWSGLCCSVQSCMFFLVIFPGQQLSVFNSQSKVFIGGKKDGSNGRIIRPFKGTIAGWWMSSAAMHETRCNFNIVHLHTRENILCVFAPWQEMKMVRYGTQLGLHQNLPITPSKTTWNLKIIKIDWSPISPSFHHRKESLIWISESEIYCSLEAICVQFPSLRCAMNNNGRASVFKLWKRTILLQTHFALLPDTPSVYPREITWRKMASKLNYSIARMLHISVAWK